MMIANAAFVADPIPAGLPQGVGGSAPAAGSGIFQQLLQGMQGEGEPAKEAASQPGTTGLEEAGEGAQSAAGTVSLPAGLLAETVGGETGLPLSGPFGNAAVEPGLQLVLTYQASKPAAARETEPAKTEVPVDQLVVQPVAAKTEEEKAETAPEEAKAEKPLKEDSAPQAGAQAPGVAPEQATLQAASAAVPAAPAAAAVLPTEKGAAVSGLEIAAGKVEANIERRQDAAPAEAGARALSRLTSLVQGSQPREQVQQPAGMVQRPGADAEAGTPKADPGSIVATGADAAINPGQKAEPAKAVLQVKEPDRTVPAGATERAQAEVRVSAAAAKVVAGNEPQNGFAPMPFGGASFQAANAVPGEAAANEVKGRIQVARVEAAPATADGKVAAEVAATATAEMEAAPVAAGQPSQENEGVAEGTQAELVKPAPQQKAQAASLEASPQTAKAEPAAVEPPRMTDIPRQRQEETQEAAPAVTKQEAAPQTATTASIEDNAATDRSATATPIQTEQGKGERQATSQDGQRQNHAGQGEHSAQAIGAGFRSAEAAAAEPAQPQNGDAAGRKALHDSILSQVKDGTVTHDGKGNGQMNIRLNPGELGELKIQVRMEDNRLRVEVQADNRTVKDLLMSNLDSLKEALSGKNLAMDGFNVSTGGGGFDSPLHGERENRRQTFARFTRGGGYSDEGQARVNYLTDATDTLLDVRF